MTQWAPRGKSAWILTAGAFTLGLLTVTLAAAMAFPLRWDGLGQLGALALMFPLHLFVITALAVLMTFLARRSRADLAASVFVVVALSSAIMALIPTIAVWRRASNWHVSLSLGTYFANALHANFGSPQADRTVAYGTAGDGTTLLLDVWKTGRVTVGPLHPAVVFVHGGAWIHGTRSMYPDWDQWLNELGYEVFDVEYRMPPPTRWQDEVGDVKSAIGWVAAHAAELHVDPARISVMGNSAGANLAMLAAYTMSDPRLPPSTPVQAVAVRSVIDLYGPADLALLYRTCKSAEFVQAALDAYIGGSPDAFPDRYSVLSPITHVNANTPPTLTILGERDRLVAADHDSLLYQALDEAGVSHDMYSLPGNDHGFDFNWGGFGTQIARAEIEEFLRDN